MNIQNWLGELDQAFCSRFMLTMLHFLWQGVLVGFVVFLLASSRLSAQTRYISNVTALLLLVACVPFTFILLASDTSDIAVNEAPALSPEPLIEENQVIPERTGAPIESPPVESVNNPPAAVLESEIVTQPSVVVPRVEEERSEVVEAPASMSLAAFATLAYFAGTAVMLMRLALGVWGVQRLQRMAMPVDDSSILTMVRTQAHRVGLKVVPVITQCQRIAVPVVVGILRPTILLPASLISGFTPTQLEAVLTHELAHIRRFDLLVNLLQRVVESLLFFHPAVWYVSCRVSTERELCCDDFVLSTGCPRTQYADALIRMAELCPRGPGATAQVTALAATGRSPSQLRHRVLRILGDNAQPRLQLTRFGVIMILLLLASIVVTPAVIQSWAQAPNAPANGSKDESADSKINQDPRADSLPNGAIARLGRLHLRPGGDVHTVVYSPDGKIVASANNEGIQLWNTETGLLIRRLSGHKSWVDSVAFSSDGKLLVSGGNDWTARIWNVETGEQVQLLRCHRYGMLGLVHEIQVAFAADGRHVITGGQNGMIQIWDALTGKELKKFAPKKPESADPHSDPIRVMALAVSPDSKVVAVGSFDKKIRLWNASTETMIRTIEVESKWVRDLKFSPDGKTLAWCGTSTKKKIDSEGIVLWDWKMNVPICKFPGHQKGRTYGIAFSPDGKQIVSSGFGNTIKLWDIDSGKEVWTARGHTDTPWKVAFAPDGKTVASCSGDGSVRLWNAKTGKSHLPNPDGHWDEVIAMAIVPDGKTVFVASKDRSIRKFELLPGGKTDSFTVNAKYIEAFAFSSNVKFAAVGYDHFVEIWDTVSGKRIWSREDYDMQKKRPEFKYPRPRHIAFSSDSKLLATTTVNSGIEDSSTIIRIWDVDSGRLKSQINRRTIVSTPPTFNADGSTLTINEYVVGDGKIIENRGIRSFSTKTGKAISEAEPPKAYANSAWLSPDGKMRVTGTSRSLIQFWDITTNELLFSFQGRRSGASINLLAFSPDGKRVAAAARGKDGVIYVWDLASGKLTNEFLHGAKSLAFTPGGKKLITGHEDGTMLVWDVATPQPELATSGITRKEFEKHWTRLGYGYDSSYGNQGIYNRTDALALGGDQTVALLEEKLFDTDLERSDEELVRRLCAPLSSKDPKVREAAVREIMKYGDHAYLATRRIIDAPASDELRSGVEQVLHRNLNYRRNSHGVIDLLRQIGTPRALRVLERLAQGPEETLDQRNRKTMATYTLKNVKELKLKRPNQTPKKSKRKPAKAKELGGEAPKENEDSQTKPDKVDLGEKDSSFAEAVRLFNEENRKLGQGMERPPLTEVEAVKAIKQADKTRDGDRRITDREFAAFQEFGKSRKLPEGAYFKVWTYDEPSTFMIVHKWEVRLFIPALDQDGFVSLKIRDTKISEEKINPMHVAWGPTDPEGLSLGLYLSPMKETYEIGDRVRLKLFVRNGGEKSIKRMTFYNITWPGPKSFTAVDETGTEIEVRNGHKDWSGPGWIAGAMVGSDFRPGTVHAFRIPFELGIGGDGSHKFVGRVVNARPGQTIQLRLRAHNGSNRRPAADEPRPESGSVTISVVKKEAKAAEPDREAADPTKKKEQGQLMFRKLNLNDFPSTTEWPAKT